MGQRYLQDHKGNNSSTRAIASMIFVVVMVAWAWLVFKNSAMADIPPSILSVLGGAATWLTANKHIELNAPNSSPPQ